MTWASSTLKSPLANWEKKRCKTNSGSENLGCMMSKFRRYTVEKENYGQTEQKI